MAKASRRKGTGKFSWSITASEMKSVLGDELYPSFLKFYGRNLGYLVPLTLVTYEEAEYVEVEAYTEEPPILTFGCPLDWFTDCEWVPDESRFFDLIRGDIIYVRNVNRLFYPVFYIGKGDKPGTVKIALFYSDKSKDYLTYYDTPEDECYLPEEYVNATA